MFAPGLWSRAMILFKEIHGDIPLETLSLYGTQRPCSAGTGTGEIPSGRFVLMRPSVLDPAFPLIFNPSFRL